MSNLHSSAKNIEKCAAEQSVDHLFIAGSQYNLRLLPPIKLIIGAATIQPSQVMFNCTVSLSSYVDQLRKTVSFQLKNLWHIRQFINKDSCHHAVRSSHLYHLASTTVMLSLHNSHAKT